MEDSIAIHSLAKNLGLTSKRIILACKTLGINAKASSKKLNKLEKDKIINYFTNGQNVSQETVEIKNIDSKLNKKPNKAPKNNKSNVKFFPNRLIG